MNEFLPPKYLLMLYIKYKVEKEMLKEKPLLKLSHTLQGITYTCHPRLKLQGPESLHSRQLHRAVCASFVSFLTHTLSGVLLSSLGSTVGFLQQVSSSWVPPERTQNIEIHGKLSSWFLHLPLTCSSCALNALLSPIVSFVLGSSNIVLFLKCLCRQAINSS